MGGTRASGSASRQASSCRCPRTGRCARWCSAGRPGPRQTPPRNACRSRPARLGRMMTLLAKWRVAAPSICATRQGGELRPALGRCRTTRRRRRDRRTSRRRRCRYRGRSRTVRRAAESARGRRRSATSRAPRAARRRQQRQHDGGQHRQPGPRFADPMAAPFRGRQPSSEQAQGVDRRRRAARQPQRRGRQQIVPALEALARGRPARSATANPGSAAPSTRARSCGSRR